MNIVSCIDKIRRVPMKTFLRGILWLLIHAFKRLLSIDNVKDKMFYLYKQIFFVKILLIFLNRIFEVIKKYLIICIFYTIIIFLARYKYFKIII